ncbi:MAG TPA: hypothetical protein VFK05_26725 [Polyangiaceae bacterium]|nr:hypothetical protein [Polyangiaceae bacterium]
MDRVSKEAPAHRVPGEARRVVPILAEFLLPIARACAHGDAFEQRWSPGGPWTIGS